MAMDKPTLNQLEEVMAVAPGTEADITDATLIMVDAKVMSARMNNPIMLMPAKSSFMR
jgi:hypothetical protein